MRDIKRVKKFCEKLTELWELYPDLRFWQIIGLLDIDSDPFFYEESKWIELFDEVIKSTKEYREKRNKGE